jgi:kynurenine formamidase
MANAPSWSQNQAEQIYEQVKAWGRWGPDDERGALNFITAEKRRQAATLVRTGDTVSCALPLATAATPENTSPVWHLMVRAGDLPDQDSAADYFSIASHGLAHTHLDALCHFFHKGYMYGGLPQSRVTSMGTTAFSIEAGKDGIFSRGILLDVPRALGRDFLEPGEAIFPDDLDRAEQLAGVRVEEGDILLVRTGRHGRARARGPWNGREALAGLHTSCLPWLAERHIALLGSDGVHDVVPSGVEGLRRPVHVGTLVYMGVHLLDNADFEALAETCARLGRWEFLLTIHPLRLEHGTASPVNPIAVF